MVYPNKMSQVPRLPHIFPDVGGFKVVILVLRVRLLNNYYFSVFLQVHRLFMTFNASIVSAWFRDTSTYGFACTCSSDEYLTLCSLEGAKSPP